MNYKPVCNFVIADLQTVTKVKIKNYKFLPFFRKKIQAPLKNIICTCANFTNILSDMSINYVVI